MRYRFSHRTRGINRKCSIIASVKGTAKFWAWWRNHTQARMKRPVSDTDCTSRRWDPETGSRMDRFLASIMKEAPDAHVRLPWSLRVLSCGLTRDNPCAMLKSPEPRTFRLQSHWIEPGMSSSAPGQTVRFNVGTGCYEIPQHRRKRTALFAKPFQGRCFYARNCFCRISKTWRGRDLPCRIAAATSLS